MVSYQPVKDCPMCSDEDPPIPIRCQGCREYFHLHDSQVFAAKENVLMIADCPSCGAHNAWVKSNSRPRGLGVLQSMTLVKNPETATGIKPGSRAKFGNGCKRHPDCFTCTLHCFRAKEKEVTGHGNKG
jgi:hypothetical protein